MSLVAGKVVKLMAVVVAAMIGGIGLSETLRATVAQSAPPIVITTATNPMSQLGQRSGLLPYVVGTVPMPLGIIDFPDMMAVNPTTGYTYLFDLDGPVSVISDNEVITNMPSIGYMLEKVAVDQANGYIYVGSSYEHFVAVISGTELLGNVDLGMPPWRLLVVPNTGYTYAGYWGSNKIAMLSGTTLITQVTLPLTGVGAMTFNPTNGWVYVADSGGGQVAVVSGTQVVGLVPVDNPGSMDVNPNTGYVYVGSYYSDSVVVLSGTMVVDTIPGVYPNPSIVKVNPATGYVYVGCDEGTVAVISGTQLIATLATGSRESVTIMQVNPATGYTYVGSKNAHQVTVISATQVITTANVDGDLKAIAVNPSVDRVYIASQFPTDVTIWSGTHIIGHVPRPAHPAQVAVHPLSGLAYVANSGSDSVSILSGTKLITTVTVGDYPYPISINPKTGYVYVEYQAGSLDRGNVAYHVAVLSSTQKIATLPAGTRPRTGGDPVPIGVNPNAGYIYVVNDGFDNSVIVLTGTQVLTTLPVGGNPNGIAVDSNTGYVYVNNLLSNTVTIIKGAQVVGAVTVGSSPESIGLNPATHFAYVANTWSNSITILSGTQSVASIPVGMWPRTIGVNSATGYAYVSSLNPWMSVLSGTQVVNTFGLYPAYMIGADESSGFVYATHPDNGLISVLSSTEVMAQLPVGGSPKGVAIDPTHHRAYVANSGSNAVSVLELGVFAEAETAAVLLSPTEDLSIDFGVPVVTSTIQFEISPTVNYTITWNAEATQAVISHPAFQDGVFYRLRLLPGGEAVSGYKVLERQWAFVYKPGYQLIVPVLFAD